MRIKPLTTLVERGQAIVGQRLHTETEPVDRHLPSDGENGLGYIEIPTANGGISPGWIMRGTRNGRAHLSHPNHDGTETWLNVSYHQADDWEKRQELLNYKQTYRDKHHKALADEKKVDHLIGHSFDSLPQPQGRTYVGRGKTQPGVSRSFSPTPETLWKLCEFSYHGCGGRTRTRRNLPINPFLFEALQAGLVCHFGNDIVTLSGRVDDSDYLVVEDMRERASHVSLKQLLENNPYLVAGKLLTVDQKTPVYLGCYDDEAQAFQLVKRKADQLEAVGQLPLAELCRGVTAKFTEGFQDHRPVEHLDLRKVGLDGRSHPYDELMPGIGPGGVEALSSAPVKPGQTLKLIKRLSFAATWWEHEQKATKKLIRAIKRDKALTEALQNWGDLSLPARRHWARGLADLQAQVWDLEAVPMVFHSRGGVAAFRRPGADDPDTNGHIRVTDAVLAEPVHLLEIVCHEMTHAYQYQLLKKADAGQLSQDDPREPMVESFRTAWENGSFSSRFSSYFNSLLEIHAYKVGTDVTRALTTPQTERLVEDQLTPAHQAKVARRDFFLEHHRGFDVHHYRVGLKVDPETNHLTAKTTLKAKAEGPLSEIELDLRGYDVSKVKVGGRLVPFEKTDQTLRIFPAKPLTGKFTVSVEYAGQAQEHLSSVAPLPVGWVSNGKASYVIGQPDGASAFFPVATNLTDKAQYTFEIEVPPGYTGIANGVLTEETETADGTRFQWKMNQPMASQVATVHVGRYQRINSTGPHGLPLRYYAPKNLVERVEKAFDDTPAMIEFFEERFGPYPFEVYGAVVVDGDLEGVALESQTIPCFGREDFYTGDPERLRAHELAHHWFGNCVTPSSWRDIWLSEGLTTYAEIMWLNRHDDDGELLERHCEDAYSRLKGHSPLSDPHPSEVFADHQYTKGALMMHGFRKKVGDDSFFETLQTYLQRFRHRNARSEDFIAVAQEVCQQPLGDFFKTWLEGVDKPPLFKPCDCD